MWRLRRPFLPSTFLYVGKEQKENKPKSWTRTRSSVHTRPATCVDDRVGQAISGTCQYRLAQRHGPGLSLGGVLLKKSIRVIGSKPIFYIGSSNRYDLYDKK
jgi:hypothetical protein